MNSRKNLMTIPLRRTSLAIGLGLCMASAGALAQSTTGTIFGQAPAVSGESVQVVGGSGFDRTVPVDQSGRFRLTVPLGTYDVILLADGKVIQRHNGVTPSAAGASQVDFSAAAATANAQNLSTITVSANSIPAIDVTSTNESTVITAEQLKHLPLGRSGAAIALLAPGTVAGAGLLLGGPLREALVSFGGSSVAENAYYINGMNTTDPLGGAGGITLPYGSIAQQETLTSGYGAQYGRSAGGVISQVGMSGTNEFHAGGQVLWRPEFAQGNEGNYHYENPRVTTAGRQKGDIYTYRNDNTQWNTVYDAYVSGPLIKDKLFFFLSAEANKTQDNAVQSNNAANEYFQKYSDPKLYAKLDWNITSNNTLALTGVKNTDSYSGNVYNYDYSTHKHTSFSNADQSFKNSFKIWNAKYTSYITDNLTLTAMYGKMDGAYYTNQPAYPGFDPSLPTIIQADAGFENPAYLAGGPSRTNSNTSQTQNDPSHTSEVTNMRLDLDWKLGNHDLQFGIDNDTSRDKNAGDFMTGPGYAWDYGQVDNGSTPVQLGSPSVSPTGAAAGGYYASHYIFVTNATVAVKQKAQYIQDDWQVNDRLLLKIGLRNDQFTNYNPAGQPFIRLTKPQLAPRLGFSWDVNGDSSVKVFGNAGRYYLALPAGLALRSASAPLYTRQFYTYTGIDSNGIPTGLAPIATSVGTNVPVPENGEDGTPINPKAVSAKNIKAEFQDEYVLGFQQQINSSWVYGVTGEVRRLGRVVDDVGDIVAVCKAMVAQSGVAYMNAVPQCLNGNYGAVQEGSVLINPGSTNDIRLANNAGGFNSARVNDKNFGFPSAAKRNYYSLELSLKHPWDGKWSANVDYVFSRSYGNTEGPVQSNIGQGGNSVSATEQWDYGQIMEYANGDQANDRKHVLKAYGTYQVDPDWSVSAILTIASGTPESCLGFYGGSVPPAIDYGGGTYHYCAGKPTPGGSTGFTPWTHTLSLSAEYRPQWADKKLGFSLLVYNATNEQKLTQIYSTYGSAGAPASRYLQPEAMETPRYLQVGVSYDW